MPIWHAIGQQLQNPRGILGVLTGMLKRVVNATPNHMAVEALEIEPRDRILELGFGPGHAIRLMVPKTPAGFVYGIDQSAVMLQQAAARNRAAIRENRVRLYQAQFENLAVNVVYFWADAPAVMREIRRVLRPGGRFCIYATERATMRNWKFAGSQTHRLYDAAALTLALRQAGFEGSQISVRKIRLAAGVQGLLATVS